MSNLKNNKSKLSKVNQIVQLIQQHKSISAVVLAEKIYGSATDKNIQKLKQLISTCRIKGGKTKNIYCIRGNYVDVSSILRNGSGS